MEDIPCIICSATDFRYDDELCRNICNVCNAMQEITGMGITTLENDTTVRFNRLQTVKLKINKKITKAERKQEELRDAKPWEPEQLFRWLFGKQIESMRPHVVDWVDFEKLCWAIWDRYTKMTGVDFDLVTARHEEVRLRKYPVGWGSRHDARKGENPLTQATRQLRRLQKEARLDNDEDNGSGDDSEIELKAARNQKKVRIERMVQMKRADKEELEQERMLMESAVANGNETENSAEISKRERLTIKKEERKRERCSKGSGSNRDDLSDHNDDGLLSDDPGDSDSDDVVESELSDEQDPSYLQLDYMDEQEKTTVRILRKKKPHEVMFNGSFYTNVSRLMESNIAMLFLGLYFSREKRTHCCCLMDVLRLVARRHIPYIGIRRFVPAHLFPIADRSYHRMLLRDKAPSWTFMLTCFYKIVRDLRFNFLVKTDIDGLIHRMIRDLNLPASLSYLTDHIRKVMQPTNDANIGAEPDSKLIRTNFAKMRQLYPYTLTPEPFCIAHVFVALRCLMKLDGQYEIDVSNRAREVALIADEADSETVPTALSTGPTRLFIWSDWWRSECRAPNLESARTWRDLERDRGAGSFAFLGPALATGCGITDDLSRYDELGLEWQPGLNNRGRLARPEASHSNQDFIDAILRPLRAVFSAFEPRLKVDSINRPDFTGTDMRYLVKPRLFWAQVLADRGLADAESASGQSLARGIDELTRLVEEHGLSSSRISFDTADPEDDVFDRDFTKNLNQIETDLLETLTNDTGFTVKEVWPYIRMIERNFFTPPVKKTRTRRKLKARRKL